MANPNPAPEHRFKKGNQAAKGHGRPLGSLGFSNRLKKILLNETASGKKVIDLLTEKLIAETLKNPAKMWPFLRDLIERDEGKVTDKIEVSGNPKNLVDMLKALESQKKEEIEPPLRN